MINYDYQRKVAYGGKRNYPLPVVIISAYPKEAILGLEYGAIEVVEKPSGPVSMDIAKIQRQMVRAVKAAAESHPEHIAKLIEKKIPPKLKAEKEILLTGASSGGPPAIESILRTFPRRFPIPVIVLQHMPALFVKTFAQRLVKTSPYSTALSSSLS